MTHCFCRFHALKYSGSALAMSLHCHEGSRRAMIHIFSQHPLQRDPVSGQLVGSHTDKFHQKRRMSNSIQFNHPRPGVVDSQSLANRSCTGNNIPWSQPPCGNSSISLQQASVTRCAPPPSSPKKSCAPRDRSPPKTYQPPCSPQKTYQSPCSPKKTFQSACSPQKTYPQPSSPKKTYPPPYQPQKTYPPPNPPQKTYPQTSPSQKTNPSCVPLKTYQSLPPLKTYPQCSTQKPYQSSSSPEKCESPRRVSQHVSALFYLVALL